MRTIYLLLLMLGFKAAYAHNPDISSMMIYEQNGKTILLIKSSLTAFEGEVDYLYGKDAYKTPEEFIKLVAEHFQKNCSLIADGKRVNFTNVQVQLGHETNLFAELEDFPKSISALYVKNSFFKDMPNNKCELIIITNGLPQEQYILNQENKQEVTLQVADKKWGVVLEQEGFNLYSGFLIGAALLLIITLISFVLIKRKRLITDQKKLNKKEGILGEDFSFHSQRFIAQN